MWLVNMTFLVRWLVTVWLVMTGPDGINQLAYKTLCVLCGWWLTYTSCVAGMLMMFNHLGLGTLAPYKLWSRMELINWHTQLSMCCVAGTLMKLMKLVWWWVYIEVTLHNCEPNCTGQWVTVGSFAGCSRKCGLIRFCCNKPVTTSLGVE